MLPKPMFRLISLILGFGFLLGACAQAPALTPTQQAETSANPPTGPTSAFPITLTDGLGRSVTLAAPAQKVVSLAPSNTEILFAIGAGSQVVGRDEFSDFPEAAKNLPSVGGSYGKYNQETIVSLKPDLVLASQLNTAEQVQALETLGLVVYLLPNPDDLEGMYANLKTVGKLTGKEAEANQLAVSLAARESAVTEKVRAVEDRPLVFYEIDSTSPNAPYTSGPHTFIDTLIGIAGGKNVGAELKDAYAQISLEELLVQNPDIILLGDSVWGGVTAEAVKARPGWEKLEAVKSGRIYPFDDNLVSRPGPRMVDGLETLAKLLHPDLFK